MTIGTSVNPLNFDMSEGGNATFSGNVGIGGSPGAKLDVNAGITNTIAIFESTDINAFLRTMTLQVTHFN